MRISSNPIFEGGDVLLFDAADCCRLFPAEELRQQFAPKPMNKAAALPDKVPPPSPALLLSAKPKYKWKATL
jgi:hypothetical protein